ncbi:alpha/beta hydrolase [Noviherbaspirillum cavernae]|uniref:Alpha/beta hydrolase n=1 Tax=Noviherbaspirillum cavernae TaxID=2320862 RepID=A0A418X275_9BURK|nr:dienelactone hydrolase family protein [Noviherbaspirillum cavernae]RJG06548.1 alpha/beta hydrolase [Noviherbaspirillum cavernae]
MTAPMQKALVRIACDEVEVEGMLELPATPIGIVLFAHGSGSSRLSPRNNYVASILRGARMGTLLMDLLTPQEDQAYQTRFNIALLTLRLRTAAAWLRQHSDTRALPLGLFGASTGAAAALQLCAQPDVAIAAVVSRGGRPDMAGPQMLQQVRTPTLLIVGGLDEVVIGLNRDAFALLSCDKQIVIVPGATHLFEEPGKLEIVAGLAKDWFATRMGMPALHAADN